MGDRRYPRARSPPLVSPGRTSLPNFTYNYPDVYPAPSRREVIATPRTPTDRANVPAEPMTTTTYKIKPNVPPVYTSSSRDSSSSHRRSTLDSLSRPTIVNAAPRHTVVLGGDDGRPQSPIHNPYRSSDEGGGYYSIPASSGRHRSHRRGAYSATMDNADVNRLTREGGSMGMLGVGTGREGARYSGRSRPIYPGPMIRHPDTTIDEYGDDDYNYTNPRDLVQYDLDRAARYPPPRRDSYEGGRPARPSSISGYADIAPRSYDNRERRPPPATRGLDRMAGRGPQYDNQPVPTSPRDPTLRSPRRERFYEEPLRKHSRRPVSVYNERPRRDENHDHRDDDARERPDKRYATRYEEGVDQRGYGERHDRGDLNGYEKHRDYKSKDYGRDDEYEEYDDRVKRKGEREKGGTNRRDHDRKDDDDHKEHKSGREKIAAGIGLAAAALSGLGLAKHEDHSESDEDKDEKDERRQRKDGDDHRRHRDNREERDTVDLDGRDPKERRQRRDDKDLGVDDNADQKERTPPKDDPPPVNLSGRNPQERQSTRETRDDAIESRENRKSKAGSPVNDTKEDARENSTILEEVNAPRRIRKDRLSTSGVAFNPKDAMDLRALKDALNKQDTSSPTAPIKGHVREGSYERKEPQGPSKAQAELLSREERGRRDQSDSEDDKRRTPPRLVSPPRETKKAEENKPKSILRQPREKFPEDPMPIREGVAPLKDAKKDGVPPDARWTKISRRLVNPEALIAGKERYEARDDFVIVLRVLTKEEIQTYATVTQQIRDAREEVDEMEQREERRHRRRERHERHKREREVERERPRDDNMEYDHEHRRHKKEKDSHSESDSTPDDEVAKRDTVPKLADAQKPRRITYDQPVPVPVIAKPTPDGSLREDPLQSGTYIGYVRNPPRK